MKPLYKIGDRVAHGRRLGTISNITKIDTEPLYLIAWDSDGKTFVNETDLTPECDVTLRDIK
jgi:hypothetical protein